MTASEKARLVGERDVNKTARSVLFDRLTALAEALQAAPKFTDPLGVEYIERTSLIALRLRDTLTTLQDFPRQ